MNREDFKKEALEALKEAEHILADESVQKETKEKIERKAEELKNQLKELTKRTEAEVLGEDKKFTIEDAKRIGNSAIKGCAKLIGISEALLKTLREKLEEIELK